MLFRINDWRFEQNLDPVALRNVVIHFVHRLWAFLLLLPLIKIIWLNTKLKLSKPLNKNLLLIYLAVAVQIMLGIFTVLTRKAPTLTSIHVVFGALVLGLTSLFLFRLKNYLANTKNLRPQT